MVFNITKRFLVVMLLIPALSLSLAETADAHGKKKNGWHDHNNSWQQSHGNRGHSYWKRHNKKHSHYHGRHGKSSYPRNNAPQRQYDGLSNRAFNIESLMGVITGKIIGNHSNSWQQSHGNRSHGHWKRHNNKYNRYRGRPGRPSYPRNNAPQRQYNGSSNGLLNTGSLIGAVAGGIIGNQVGKGSGKTFVTVGGALIGMIVGNSLYRDIEARDEAQASNALETVPTGQTVRWKNPDTGDQFEVQPTRTFKNVNNQDCRDYTTWVFIDGYEKKVSGTACRAPDGHWQLVSR